jgi:hypothetical protein
MRRNSFFWGAVLLLVGLVMLINSLGIVHISLWPVFLIALGLWMLYEAVAGRRPARTEAVSIPLQGAGEARLRVNHGAGRLRIESGAGAGELLVGTCGGGAEQSSRLEGSVLHADLSTPVDVRPWSWGSRGYDCSLRLNGAIPLALELKTGANEANLDLTDLRVSELCLETGASSTQLVLPARAGFTRVSVTAGAASLKMRVLPGVAARIGSALGLGSLHVDRIRFQPAGDVYQSPDYESAANRVEIHIEGGVASVDVE